MRREDLRRHLGPVALACALVVPTAVGGALTVTGAPKRIELETVQLRFSVRGTSRAPTNVVLVAIDRASLTAMRSTWPLARERHAQAIDRLAAAGAAQIAYDVEFPGDGSTPDQQRGSAAIRTAARRAGNVTFAAFAPNALGQTNVLAGGDRASSVHTGFSGFHTANGVPVSKVPASVSGLTSLSLAVARSAGARTVAHHPAWIDFVGPPGTIRDVRFSDLLADRVPASSLRGKIVVVAATDPAIKDVLATVAPGGEEMSGGELQANAITTWLRGTPLRSAHWWLDAIIVALMGLALPVLSLRARQGIVWACAAGLLAAFAIATQLLFEAGVVTVVVAPLAAFTLSLGTSLAIALRRADRERQALRERFAAGDLTVVEPALAGRVSATSIVAGYRIEELLARGGMGVIYRATQLALDRPVAVKLIAPELAADPGFRTRFELESRTAAAIEHPNIIPVYEAGDDAGLLFIAMRLVDGIDLARLVARSGPLPAKAAADIVVQAAGALEAAHGRDLVHRDVKPGNLLIGADDPTHVYLTDFGLARHLGQDTNLTHPDGWVGTLDFVAPEQLRNHSVDRRADVYALAGVLYFCLTGEPPFGGQNAAATMWAHLNAAAPLVSAKAPDVPPAFDDLVAAGLAKDPADRPPTAHAFATAVAAAASEPGTPATAARQTPAVPHAPLEGPTIASDGS
jgi:CHASE2 domain-containing sensor protein